MNAPFTAFDDAVCVPVDTIPEARAAYPEAVSLWLLVKVHTPYTLEAWRDTAMPVASHYVTYQQGYNAVHALADTLRQQGMRVWVDFTLRQKPLAQQLGLGWIGRQTLLHHPVYGSYVCLYTLLTDTENTSYPPRESLPSPCGNCTACAEACPTAALETGFCREKCIRNWQLNPQQLPPEMEPFMGRSLLGCDLCQRACPYNPIETIPPSETVQQAVSLLEGELEEKLPRLKTLLGANMIRRTRVEAAVEAAKRRLQ